jgi:8-oxo-dGTP pyrophosphatase MutT (NUDIX family)
MIKKCGVIFYDNVEKKYLLVFGNKSEKWGFPKGHQEIGESEEETAIRELYEETGIHIHKNELMDKIRFKNNIYFNVIMNKPKPVFNIQDTKEILKACWFSMHEIMNLPKESINYGLKSWLNYMLIDIGIDYRFPKFVNNKENSMKSIKYY